MTAYVSVDRLRPGDLLAWNSQVGLALVVWARYLWRSGRHELGVLYSTGELNVQEFLADSTINRVVEVA